MDDMSKEHGDDKNGTSCATGRISIRITTITRARSECILVSPNFSKKKKEKRKSDTSGRTSVMEICKGILYAKTDKT